MPSQPEILQELMSSWVSLALEFATGAPDVSTIFIYASSEQGSSFANAYFEQNGEIVFPDDLSGVSDDSDRVGTLQRLLLSDLRKARGEFTSLGEPAPTEYRVTYDVASGRLDSALSHELIYANDPDKLPESGIEYWLGDRAPKLF